MRIFFLEERLAGKGGAKVRKWRSDDGINYDQLISEDKDEDDDKLWITLEFQPNVRENLLNSDTWR